MDQKIEKYGEYAQVSKNILDRMKRRAEKGDFDRAFSTLADLLKEDDAEFEEFLKSPEIQEKIANRIKILSELIENSDEIGNVNDLKFEIPKLLLFIDTETAARYEIQKNIQALERFIEELEYSDE